MKQVFKQELIGPIIIILITIIFYVLFKKLMLTTFMKKAKRNSNKKALTMITVGTNVVKYMLLIIDTLIILDIWGVDTKALIASIGVVGVIIGFALQDLLKDLISGTAILSENQFKVGDNVKIGDFRGDVIYLGLKSTKVRAYTGEVKIIANRNITEVINYSLKNSKCVVTISTSYEDDINKVKDAINNVCERLSKEVDYVIGKIKILGVDKLSDSSVDIKIAADTKPTYDIAFRRILLEEVVKEFKKQNLNIPYPQLEVHHEK